MTVRQAIVFTVLLLAVVASGVQVALVSHEVRRLHGELEAAQKAQDEHLAEYSRLLLERSALSAYQNVERLAETELGMRFPDKVEHLKP
ncbi:MAG: cell division protein FtsL [Gammaproteobacteria bacterium]|jgi:cell division protein FtsL|nr:cell division protein FtsL [Gammaproteobacteria bacterium]